MQHIDSPFLNLCPNRLVRAPEDVDYPEPRLQLAVKEELVAVLDQCSSNVDANEILGRDPVQNQLTKVLTKAAADVEICRSGRLEAFDNLLVERMGVQR